MQVINQKKKKNVSHQLKNASHQTKKNLSQRPIKTIQPKNASNESKKSYL